MLQRYAQHFETPEMLMNLSITKEYIVDKTFEETFSRLDSIISTNFYDTQYSTFGNFVSAEPPEFLFMAKWATIGRPFFAEFPSTKVYAKLFKLDNKSKITIVTTSNPGILCFFIFLLVAALTKLVTYKTQEDLKLLAIYFLFAVGALLLDRFIKNIVISSFETDMKLK